ncbi:hypothetical protein M0811_04338 [Anaeramoeba ignava]|uniref:Uncharacterized protein n=1 Tax=Anaeramoeba ignava TaxID=1746090 RepID=A0A9Q0RGK6_ANAIG|nr:hypothetical protein M0811_04338 [Anaeramoeba ignava]
MKKPDKSNSLIFVIVISGICLLLVIAVFMVPSLLIAYPDRNIDCSEKLWSWILVCNVTFGGGIVLSYLSSMVVDQYQSRSATSTGLSLFLFVWSVVGLVWASKDGVKDQCGKLWSVTMADSITIISLNFLGFVLGMIFFATHR